jgi:hypothetical protein
MVLKKQTSLKVKSVPTQRAPDAGDSAHIPSLFHASAFFWLDGFAVPAPAQVPITCSVKSLGCNLGNQFLDDLSRLRERPFFLFPAGISLF